MARIRSLKLPREKLPEPLANCLRLHGFNWQGQRSRDGKLWTVYKYGKPARKPNRFQLHSDTPVEHVVRWCQLHEQYGSEGVPPEIGARFGPTWSPSTLQQFTPCPKKYGK